MALIPTSALLRLSAPSRTWTCTQCRHLHRLNASTSRIPRPTPFVPDVPTFLTLIGRGLSQHAAKIPSWEALFSLSSEQLKESGVEPARARRYLLWWRDRFRNGIMEIGGDLKEVKDGIAELRIVEVPSSRPFDQAATLTKGPGARKMVVNVTPTVLLPPDPAKSPDEEGGRETFTATMPHVDLENVTPVTGVKISQANRLGGTGVEPVKGHQGVAQLRVKEGLWEERRGHKVDGGERRKAEVRYKRKVAEKKNAR